MKTITMTEHLQGFKDKYVDIKTGFFTTRFVKIDNRDAELIASESTGTGYNDVKHTFRIGHQLKTYTMKELLKLKKNGRIQ